VTVNTPTSTNLVDGLRFVTDVTIPDNTAFSAGASFLKTWRVKNTGTTTWDSRYTVAFFSDVHLGTADTFPLPSAKPGDIVEITIPMTAPAAPGTYKSVWKAKNSAGVAFGAPFYALIQVR
jgi:hypothetical protein